MKFQSFITAKVVAGLLVCLMVGCGESGPKRVPVSGTVSYQGTPLVFGQIRFVPVDTSLAPISGGTITDGKYRIDHKGGVPVGSHKVQIAGYKHKLALSHHAPEPGDPGYIGNEQILPDIYNERTELTLTIEPDSSAITRDFELP